jgi:hypothetical protein
MPLVARLAVATCILTLPATLLAAAVLGPRPRRVGKSLVLGLIAGAPAVVVLGVMHTRHSGTVVHIGTILLALVPGYVVAGALLVRELIRSSADWWAEHRIAEELDPLMAAEGSAASLPSFSFASPQLPPPASRPQSASATR